MADIGQRVMAILVIIFLLFASVFVSAQEYYKETQDSRSSFETQEVESNNVKRAENSLWQQGPLAYRHVWPVGFLVHSLIDFGWT